LIPRRKVHSTQPPIAELHAGIAENPPASHSDPKQTCFAGFDAAHEDLRTFAVRFASKQRAPGALTRAQTGFIDFLHSGACTQYPRAGESAVVALTLIAFFSGEDPSTTAANWPHRPNWLLGPLLLALSQCRNDNDTAQKIRFAHILEL